MPITDEQAKTIKEQILGQIESFPADKRESAKSYILGMNNQQLEEFLIQNKLIKTSSKEQQTEEKQISKLAPQKARKQQKLKIKENCIFCLLSNKLVPALIIYEDEKYLACLEINPLNPGHTILIPKKHTFKTKSLKQTAFSLADKIGKHLIKQLEAQNFQISSSDALKHAIINIIPLYKKQKPEDLKKSPATKEELIKIAKKIGPIEKTKKPKKAKKEIKAESKNQESPVLKEEKVQETLLKLPRRIP